MLHFNIFLLRQYLIALQEGEVSSLLQRFHLTQSEGAKKGKPVAFFSSLPLFHLTYQELCETKHPI